MVKKHELLRPVNRTVIVFIITLKLVLYMFLILCKYR
jgi:hypothetical protein